MMRGGPQRRLSGGQGALSAVGGGATQSYLFLMPAWARQEGGGRTLTVAEVEALREVGANSEEV